ncbi:unnamed protein product [Nippostrongylus brasiliensis]|uniref:Histidine-rich membrane protein KE4 homolog 2 (inferred by orthology to a C. elegans protein) n=1 Tax=Nippostrongylus brasiliensis TaxID=27835 RepID=A0A0N4XTI1_NIPBR|nr:unnamed protein product [Nippostrongylus brasiliensis]
MEMGDEHGHSHEHAHDHHGHSHGSGGCPHAHSHGGHDHDNHAHHAHSGERRSQLWLYSIGATLLISAAPCFLLLFIPIQDNSPSSGPWLKVLLAFGSGGLLGDAFLHLIPHAAPSGSGSHSHSHAHSHSGAGGHSHEPHDMSVGGWVLAGIIAFLVVEKVVRIIRGEDGHGHSHGPAPPKPEKVDMLVLSYSAIHDDSTEIMRLFETEKAKVSDDEDSDGSQKSAKSHTSQKSKDVCVSEQKHGGIKVAAYLNLVADFAHNFTDGLAIGASFTAGTTAMGIQLITALGALSGCMLSLWVADPTALADSAASSWILPFTAGGFIYIATVSVIPELLEQSSTGQSLREMIAMAAGIFMMYLIAIYE